MATGQTFTTFVFQVQISGAWVDLTSDVMANSVKGSRGGSSTNYFDRVAEPGVLSFDLDNSASNSAGLIGYYSPEHANCLTGWTTGLPVRWVIAFQGFTRVKWYGHIEPNGIKVMPFENGQRKVKVTCHDFMGRVAAHQLDLLTAYENKTTHEAVDLLFAGLPVSPLDIYLDAVSDTFTYLFDSQGTETTLAGELQKITLSVNNLFATIRGDELNGEVFTLTKLTGNVDIPIVSTESRLLMENGDTLLLENGDFLLLDDSEELDFTEDDFVDADISYGDHIYNKLTVVIYPRRIDAAGTVLYSLERTTELAAGGTVIFRGPFKDPTGVSPKVNCLEFTGLIYEANANSAGTGADLTASMEIAVYPGAAESEFLVRNAGGSTFYFGGTAIPFKFLGRGVYLDDPVNLVTDTSDPDIAASILLHGVRPYTVDKRYATDVAQGMTDANSFAALYDAPKYFVNSLTLFANASAKNMLGFLFAEPAFEIPIFETMTAIGADRLMVGYEFEVIGKNIVKWRPKFTDSFTAGPGG
jgi:hypothetical protein